MRVDLPAATVNRQSRRTTRTSIARVVADGIRITLGLGQVDGNGQNESSIPKAGRIGRSSNTQINGLSRPRRTGGDLPSSNPLQRRAYAFPFGLTSGVAVGSAVSVVLS